MTDSVNEEIVSDEEITEEEVVETETSTQNSEQGLANSVMHEKNMQTVSAKQKVGKVFIQIALYSFFYIQIKRFCPYH